MGTDVTEPLVVPAWCDPESRNYGCGSIRGTGFWLMPGISVASGVS